MNISVIIPTYKPRDYIWDCLDSVMAQDFDISDYEVLIILNGEKEPYYSSILTYCEKQERNIRLIYEVEGNVSKARNIGIEKSCGEYITFIDDDDFVSPSYLKELFEKATNNVVPLCYPLSFTDGSADYKSFHITKNYEKNIVKEVVSINQARAYFSGPVYKLLHRDIIGNDRFNPKLRNGEDTLFMFTISRKIKCVKFTSKNAVYYRRFRENSALTRKKTFNERFHNNKIQLKEYFNQFGAHWNEYNIVFFLTRVVGSIVGIIKS